jgi:hypothetical protein
VLQLKRTVTCGFDHAAPRSFAGEMQMSVGLETSARFAGAPGTSDTLSIPRNVDDINAVLQAELRRRRLDEVSAVEAARWLDAAGVLKDTDARPGLPLRDLLRAGRIDGAIQRPAAPHGRWYIARSGRVASDSGERPTSTGDRKGARRRSNALQAVNDQRLRARRRRERAARKYRPDDIKLLLVAEAPPAALDRYFYFEDVPQHDSLFRYVARSILETEPTRANKAELLARLRDKGVFLIDLKRDPVQGESLATAVPDLLRRIRKLNPQKIIVIKASVYDVVHRTLGQAGLPIVDERVPFPGSGQQRRFEVAFARALRRRPSRPH